MLYNRKIVLIIFLSLLFSLSTCHSFAAYDVVKATTVIESKDSNYANVVEPESYEGADVDKIEIKNDLYKIIEKKVTKLLNKRKKTNVDLEEDDEGFEDNNLEASIKDEINTEISNNLEHKKFVGYSKEDDVVDDKNKFLINADSITYNDEEGNIYAKGNVEIVAKTQGFKLKADNLVLDKTAQTLKLTDNVKIIKNGTEMRGESLVVDLNEQNILMDSPTYEAYSFVINAQEGFLIANDIQMLNGSVASVQKKEFPLVTKGFMRLDPTYNNSYFDNEILIQDNGDSSKKRSYKIDAKEIIITSHKDHNSLIMKGSDIYYNNRKIAKNSDIEIISDKTKQIIETNMPEAGNLRNFGTYIGYGFLFKMPKGHTLKLMPVLAYKDGEVGVGAIARYRTRSGIIDGGWNSASENLVVRGKQQLTNSLSLNFGRNAYLPEGFMGARRSGYAAQLQYIKSYAIKDLDVNFSNGVYAGIFSDYQKHDQEDAYSTTRFRYMAQLSKDLYKYTNPEQDFTMFLTGISQGAATVYGSGETHGIVRIGPRLTTRFKRWEQSLGYFLTGEHGKSAFLFDRYLYGKSTITLSEKFNFNDKFSLGFRLYVTPMKDNYKEDLLTECRFFVVAGPRDAKIALSYDFVRDIAHMDFMFLIGSENSRINFEKLSTQDIDGKAAKRDFYKRAKRIKIENPENI